MSGHQAPRWLNRIGKTRVGAVCLGYMAVSWGILEIAHNLEVSFHFPEWFLPGVWLLLGIGFLVILGTALVQAAPPAAAGAAEGSLERGEGEQPSEGGLDDVIRRIAPWFKHLTLGKSILAGVGAFVTLFALSALFPDRDGELRPSTVAILPFWAVGPDVEYLQEGMVNLLYPTLNGIDSLHVISPDSVLDLSRGRKQKGVLSRDQAVAMARRLGAAYAIAGSAMKTGGEVRLTADVYNVRTGKSEGQVQERGTADSLGVVIDRFAAGLLGKLPGGAGPGEVRPGGALPPSVGTSSGPALKAYQEGEERTRKADLRAAKSAYLRALEADSTFAMAFYRLLLVGWIEPLTDDTSQRLLERGFRLADKLPEEKARLVRATQAYGLNVSEGIRQLGEAVKQNSRDTEAWYFLGEAQFFTPDPTYETGLAESERALASAVASDSGFGPAYIHLIELAFTQHADSARAARLISAFERIAADSSLEQTQRLALALAFGAPPARKSALAALDDLPFPVVDRVPYYLAHPALWGASEEAQARLRDRPEVGEREASDRTKSIVYLQLSRGRLRAAWEELSNPQLAPVAYSELAYAAWIAGFAVPADVVKRHLTLSQIPAENDVRNFYAGAYAADHGRWSESEEAMARFDADERRFRAFRDDQNGTLAASMAQALRGYAAWRRGDPNQGYALLDEAERLMDPSGVGYAPKRIVRTWLALLNLERGQPAAAEGLLYAADARSLMALPLARAYEAAGDHERARRFYEWLTIAWRDADPELQPAVQEAREALQRLGS
jgi:TolB-like protein